jgi:hypothetical protein
MTPEEAEQLDKLCALIVKEQDNTRFLKLVSELNDLLERRHDPLQPAPPRPDPTL